MATFSQQLCYDDQNSKMYENIPFFNFYCKSSFLFIIIYFNKTKVLW